MSNYKLKRKLKQAEREAKKAETEIRRLMRKL